jgi:hypothetical protein
MEIGKVNVRIFVKVTRGAPPSVHEKMRAMKEKDRERKNIVDVRRCHKTMGGLL